MKTKGWKQIFQFTYTQSIKGKSFKTSTIVICIIVALICAAINILPTMFSDDQSSSSGDINAFVKVKTLYVCNETEIPDFDFALLSEVAEKTESVSAEDAETKAKEIAEGDDASLLLHITEETTDEESSPYFSIKLYCPENDELVSNDDAQTVLYICKEYFYDALLMSIGVDESDFALAKTSISSETIVYGEEMSVTQEIVNMIVPMITALLLFTFIISYSQLIAQSVAMEKTSRVIEMLITNVRPLAIVIGKVLGMLFVCLTQILIIGAVGAASFALTMPFGIFGGAQDTVQQTLQSENISDVLSEISASLPGLFNAGSILLIILTVLLGFVFFALIAAIAGASVSRSEDLPNAIQPMMFMAVIGFMLAYIPSAFSSEADNTILVFARFFPLSSPFALPSAIITGSMSGVQTALSVAFLAVLVGLAALLTAKIYENIILYSGKLLKFSQIIKMAKKN